MPPTLAQSESVGGIIHHKKQLVFFVLDNSDAELIQLCLGDNIGRAAPKWGIPFGNPERIK